MLNIQVALRWADAHLKNECYIINAPAIAVREMPWSKVYRFSTSQGFIYLKQMAPLFSIEPTVLKILFNILPANIPKIIATNSDLNCFMMQAAGKVLRDHLKTPYQIGLIKEIFKAYSQLQQASIDRNLF